MGSTAPRSKRGSRGWWKLLSGVMFAFGATLGLGFYLPLRQTHQLLKKEVAETHVTVAQLKQALASSEAKLQQTSAERSALEGFKTQVDSESQRFSKLATDFSAQADGALAAALSKKSVQPVALADGLGLSLLQPSLLTWKRNAPSPTADKLLCPAVKIATHLGLSEVTIRTFVAIDAAAPDAEAAYAAATTLASAFAERLTRLCSLAPGSVSLASSLAKDAALARLEFRQVPAPGQPGL